VYLLCVLLQKYAKKTYYELGLRLFTTTFLPVKEFYVRFSIQKFRGIQDARSRDLGIENAAGIAPPS